MIRLSLAAVADAVGGRLVDRATGDRLVEHVTIDSRTARHGSLFVALVGEHADGHDFAGAAVAAGAAGYLARPERAGEHPGGIAVDEPAAALLRLGTHVRDVVDPTVVAVTGTSGKTTTKDLTRAALATTLRVTANPGSFNNELGVPLTCCELHEDTEVLVTELGARGRGHIAAMAAIVRPDVGVVTCVGAGHLEMFGDLDQVMRAKRELVEALGSDGVAVLNADDPRVLAMAPAAAGRVLTYGVGADADLRARDVGADALARPVFTVRGVTVQLPLPGAHNVGNALAALAVAEVCGVDLQTAAAALAGATVSRWRMELQRTDEGVTVLNDAYNANPSSVAAALRTLAAMAVEGRRIAVLGHMAELGAEAAAAHVAAGRLAGELGVDVVVAVGTAAAGIAEGAAAAGAAVERAADPDAAAAVLADRLRAGDAVLVKASRSAGLERTAALLVAAHQARRAGAR